MDDKIVALFSKSISKTDTSSHGQHSKPKLSSVTLKDLPVVKNDAAESESIARTSKVLDSSATNNGAKSVATKSKKKRKRDDLLLEDLYFDKLLPRRATPRTSREVDQTTRDQASIDADLSSQPMTTTKNKADASDNPKIIEHEVNVKSDSELQKAKCTLFVGNLPKTVITSHADYKELKACFAEYGRVKSIRFRSIAFSEMLPRKVAFLQNKLHPERDTFNGYVVYAEENSAKSALSLNGHYFQQKKHIRVDSIVHPRPHDNKRSIFIGSLPFDVEEELLWDHFQVAGVIESVRLIRDKKTNVGKGFAYVQYKHAASVQNALLLNEKKLNLGDGKFGRKLRVMRSQNMPSLHKANQRSRDQLSGTDLKPREKAKLGRVRSFMGSQAAAKLKMLSKEAAIEGERAKAPDGSKPARTKKKSKKDLLRSKSRAAIYRKSKTTE